MQQLFSIRAPRRLAAVLTVAAFAGGCATLEGDPYYDGGYAGPGYYPAHPPVAVYEQPTVIYTAPPPGWRAEAWREHQLREARQRRWEWERREADRQRAHDRQREAERRDRDQRREAERREAERRHADQRERNQREWERRSEMQQRNVPNDRQREIWQREQRLLNHPDPNVVRARREQFERDRQAERENQRGTPPWPR